MEPPSKQLKQNISRAIILRMLATDVGQSIALTGGLLGLIRIALVKQFNDQIPQEVEEIYAASQYDLQQAAQHYASGEFWPAAQADCLFVFIQICELCARLDLTTDDSLSIDVMDFINQGGQVAGMEQRESIAAHEGP